MRSMMQDLRRIDQEMEVLKMRQKPETTLSVGAPQALAIEELAQKLELMQRNWVEAHNQVLDCLEHWEGLMKLVPQIPELDAKIQAMN
jgi:hypothetical protein